MSTGGEYKKALLSHEETMYLINKAQQGIGMQRKSL